MKKVSIIIPIFNKEIYLENCLDSIITQTMPQKDIEIICVDDKSIDSSMKILRKYAKIYSNITIVEMEKNSGGPSEPRNKGINLASGDYVFFVDADDYLGKESLERLYRYAKQNDSDIVIGKYKGVGGRGVPKSMFQQNTAYADLINSRIVYSLSPQKLFRLNLLKDNNIKFPNINSGEDQLFVMRAYLASKTISILSDYDYYYLVAHPGEHMSAAYVPPEEFYGTMGDIITCIKHSSFSCIDKKKLIATFLNRHFDFSRTTNFTTKIKDKNELKLWMAEIFKFISKVPMEVDTLVYPHIQIRLHLIRNNDLETLSSFENEEKKQSYNIKVLDNKLIAEYVSLSEKKVPLEYFVFNYRNKLNHFISNFSFEKHQFIIEGCAEHKLLNNHYNKIQHLTGVLVHRESKKELYYSSEINNFNSFNTHSCDIESSKNGTKRNLDIPNFSSKFRFLINFKDFIKEDSDFGIWDFFLESSIDDYLIRGRIGNKRKALKTCTNFVSDDYNYTVRPYFTFPYNNLSFEIKEINILSKIKNLISKVRNTF